MRRWQQRARFLPAQSALVFRERRKREVPKFPERKREKKIRETELGTGHKKRAPSIVFTTSSSHECFFRNYAAGERGASAMQLRPGAKCHAGQELLSLKIVQSGSQLGQIVKISVSSKLHY